MKDKIMQNLIGVLNALNNISVSGKTNLATLSGRCWMILTLSRKARKKRTNKTTKGGWCI